MILNRTFASVLFDVDGTLIDSNGAHAAAWAGALRGHGVRVDEAQVRPLIGMGADKLLPAIANLDDTSPEGRAIARRKKELFDELLPRLRPTPGARALLEYLRSQRIDVVIATSAGERDMDALLKQAKLDGLVDRHASKSDAAESKPDPDIVCAALALARSGPESTVMVGDTPYDIQAARRAGIATIALRCGGYWSDRDLDGALCILRDPQELLDQWRHAATPG
jgi:HAD superfamily hydrolase (TIGR01509 family)